MKNRIFALLMALVVLSFAAAPVHVISPVEMDINEGEAFEIGPVGPGQTIEISVDADVETGGVHGQGGRWEYLIVEDLPSEKWQSTEGRYSNPLQVQVRVPINAADGEYEANITLIDEKDAERIGGEFSFGLKVQVDNEVIEMDVSPKEAKVGASQPAKFIITVKNTGVVDDVFDIRAHGKVSEWNFVKRKYIPAGGSKQIVYEVVGKDEETYEMEISVESASSDLISQKETVNLEVETNLISDYRATTHGLLVFPVFEQPIYSLMGLVSNLFPE